MATPWVQTSGPAGPGSGGDLVTLIDGLTFCISEDTGRVRPGHAQGLFVRDTRVLSQWELRVDGVPAEPLTVQVADPFAAMFIGRVPPAPGHADSHLLVLEHRRVGNGMSSDITIRNLGAVPVHCTVELIAGTDFADLFEVKDGRAGAHGQVKARSAAGTLEFDGRRGRHTYGLRVVADAAPTIAGDALSWVAAIDARASWNVCVEVRVTDNAAPLTLRHPCGVAVEHTMPARSLREWRSRRPEIGTADPNLAAVMRRSVEDLGALRMLDPQHPDRAVVAAGLPWFMALFGRDALITSWMMLLLDTRLAIGTLQTLAAHQGAVTDPVTEEQPGRILHEMRFGPAVSLALGGRNAYYGSVDATPLFVMVLGELSRWGVARDVVESLLPHADRALEWIDRYGDADGDGFVEYQRSSEQGLVNQGWKDSPDGVTHADGSIARTPIALAEVQGYTYAAYAARSRLAREHGDTDTARHWSERARCLAQAFDEAFWLPERGWYALGLDADKRPIDSLASNIGHCLWSGIIRADKAPSVAEHLLSPEMFSGWGIRTLATSMGAYNPMSYHNGSVWPHDNALCAAGLMRYGFVEHAQRVAVAVLDAAAHFGHRLPELFCGFTRTEFTAPVPYPTACAPQAWAAAAPFQLLRTLLRFDPHIPAGRVWCAPTMPPAYLPFRIDGLELHHRTYGIDITKARTRVAGLADHQIQVIQAPAPVHDDP